MIRLPDVESHPELRVMRLVGINACKQTTQWREEGENGVDEDGRLTQGRYFCVFGDGIWYKFDPPRCTPWTVYLGVMKRFLRAQRAD